MNSSLEDSKMAYDEMASCWDQVNMKVKLIRMMYYSVITQANSEKEIPSAPIRSRT